MVAQTLALKAHQETPDPPAALARVPSLRVGDLAPLSSSIPIDVREVDGGARVVTHDLFTSGIAYVDAGFDLRRVPLQYVPLLPLFCDCLTEMGTDALDFVGLQQRIGQTTGGIRTTTSIATRYGLGLGSPS